LIVLPLFSTMRFIGLKTLMGGFTRVLAAVVPE
jgi:hypothetical protein